MRYLLVLIGLCFACNGEEPEKKKSVDELQMHLSSCLNTLEQERKSKPDQPECSKEFCEPCEKGTKTKKVKVQDKTCDKRLAQAKKKIDELNSEGAKLEASRLSWSLLFRICDKQLKTCRYEKAQCMKSLNELAPNYERIVPLR